MNYLLDTHVLIRSITEKEKLSKAVRKIFKNGENSFSVSTISFWEVSLKFSSGKLQLKGFMPDEIPLLSLHSGFKIISISPEETSSNYRLIKTGHKDPFDRMLIWQAIQRNLIFITKDDDLGAYKIAGLNTFW